MGNITQVGVNVVKLDYLEEEEVNRILSHECSHVSSTIHHFSSQRQPCLLLPHSRLSPVFHDDAFFAAKEVFRSAGVIKKLGSKQIPSVALSPKNFQFLLRELLIVKQYRVEVYGSAGSTSKLGSKEQWDLQYTGSPGNLTMFEDVLYADHAMTEAAGGGCVAIRLGNQDGRRVVGVAFCDAASRRLLQVAQVPLRFLHFIYKPLSFLLV